MKIKSVFISKKKIFLLLFGESINETFHLNIQDTRAALRFLMNNKDVIIDEKQVYLAGSSAGGIIALTTTFYYR